jgi:hypothetical protein
MAYRPACGDVEDARGPRDGSSASEELQKYGVVTKKREEFYKNNAKSSTAKTTP